MSSANDNDYVDEDGVNYYEDDANDHDGDNYFYNDKDRRKRKRHDNDDDNDNDNDNDNNNDNNDNNENVTSSSSYTKKERKVCNLFGSNLVSQALSSGWEDQEVARLIMLMADELRFNNGDLYKFLASSECCTPGILSTLMDDEFELSPMQLLSLVAIQADTTNSFISIINESVEQNLFDLNDDDTLQAIFTYTENYSFAEMQTFVTALCSQVNSKRSCGKMLSVFTGSLEPPEAASMIVSIVYLDFFSDLKGNMESFLSELSDIRSEVEALIEEEGGLKANGEPVYSDEDENGNLAGFVCDDDDDHDEDNVDDDDDDDEDGIIYIDDNSNSPSPAVIKRQNRRIIDDDED